MDTSPGTGSEPVETLKLTAPGERVDMVLESLGAAHSAYGGDARPVLIGREARGNRVQLPCWQRVLADAVLQARPAVGDRVSVEYVGERTSRAGRQFKAFRLWVNGDETAGGGLRVEPTTWDALAGASEPELPADPLSFGGEDDGVEIPF